jgi:predicted MFS family arabinose efflux permease
MTATAAAPLGTTGPRSLWRNHDFMALWSGQILSTLGSRISATALPLLVLATTGSAGHAGLVAAAGSLPHLLLNLPAGTLVDRWPRRRIMLISHLIAAVAVASIPVALWLGSVNVAHLAVVAFTDGACFVFYGLAEHAATPRIVPSALLPAALAQNEAKGRGASLAGPPLGGLLYGLGRTIPFLADAVSYLIAAISLWWVRGDLQPDRVASPASVWRDTAAGLSWLLRNAFVRAAVLLIAASNLIFQALALVLIVRATDQGATPGTVGVMLGIYGGGGLLGALAAARLHRLFAPKVVVIGINWIWAALMPLLAIAPHPLPLGVIAGGSAFIGPMWNVVIGTYGMILVPNDLLGRVNSAAMTLAWGVMPLGALTAGLLLQTIGPVRAILVLSAVMLGIAVAATASPSIRNAPPLPASVEPLPSRRLR